MQNRFILCCAGDHSLDSYELDMDGTPHLVGRYRLPEADGRNGSAPMAASPDGRFLYVAFRGLPYRVYVFEIAETELRHVGTAPLPADMCHISFDTTGRYLFGASFEGGVISVSEIGEDRLPARTRIIPTPPNPHFVTITAANRRLLVPSLSADLLLIYDFDGLSGLVRLADRVKLAAGSGPRHLAMVPTTGQWFLISEKAGTVTSIVEDEKNRFSAGAVLSILQHPPVVPKASDIRISRDSNALYAAERNEGRIGIFDISTHGCLTRLGEATTTPFPRVMAADRSGRFLLVASEKTSQLAVHPIDLRSGMLRAARLHPTGLRPSWISVL
ncbi:lactonase family protein [Neorhizobium sp. DT-125]|uniref:lactonase family protein n=1 Tax=Neorhizobium sp. DT-125 TaxID=3396163 RepID=UPI003F1C61AC